jgi:hypothetical protein
MRVSTSIDIDATADEVWEVIGPGFTRVGEWVSAIAASEATGDGAANGMPAAGRVCRVVTAGVDRITEQLTAYDPAARRLGYRVAGGMPSFVGDAGITWQAQPLPDGRTEFTMAADVTLTGFGRLVGLFLRLYLARVGRRTSRDLKALLETGAPSRAKAIASHSARRTMLDRAVLSNAAFSAVSGLAVAVASTWWSSEFGSPESAVIASVGVSLVGYGLLLAWASGRGVTGESGRVVAALDAAWVVGTVAVLAALGSEFTTVGLIAAALSGVVVAALGALQWRAAGRIDPTAVISARPTGAVGSPPALPVNAVPAEAVERRAVLRRL